MSNLYRGTSLDQDGRFCNRDKKLINLKQWPKEFEKKIDISKIELQVIKKWAERKTQEILGFEDDIVVNYVISGLQNQYQEKSPNAKQLYLNLAGFLGVNTQQFMMELWKILDEAQNNQNNLPISLIQEKYKKTILEQQSKLQHEIKRFESLEKYYNMIEKSGEMERFKKKQILIQQNPLQNIIQNNYHHNKYFQDKKQHHNLNQESIKQEKSRSRSRNKQETNHKEQKKPSSEYEVEKQKNKTSLINKELSSFSDSNSLSSHSSKQSSNFNDEQDIRSEF